MLKEYFVFYYELCTHVLHACSKVDVVRKEIVKFSNICQSNYDNRKLILATLRQLSKKHLQFIEYSENVEDVFSYVSFFHVPLLTLLQVLSGYMFIDVRPIVNRHEAHLFV